MSWLAALVTGLLTAVAGMAVSYLAGRRASNAKRRADDGEAYRKTRERIDNATNPDLDDDAVLDRLRRRAGQADRDL